MPKKRQPLRTFYFITPEGCWEWLGSSDKNGYGRYSPVHGVTWQAHRYVFTLIKGDIPENMQLDHLCRNTGCVNPEHLEIVSNRENCKRRSKAKVGTNARQNNSIVST